MTDPRKGIPSLDAQSIEACKDKIDEALKLYNCEMIFEGPPLVNGMPIAPGRFRIIKASKKPQDQSTVIATPDAPQQ